MTGDDGTLAFFRIGIDNVDHHGGPVIRGGAFLSRSGNEATLDAGTSIGGEPWRS
jgi:hypothetical protein